MSYTLFLLKGSSNAKSFVRQFGSSLNATCSIGSLDVQWVSRKKMKEIASELSPGTPVPDALLESVAGETGAVSQDSDLARLRATLVMLIAEAHAASQALHRKGAVSVSTGSKADSAPAVRNFADWVPVGKAAIGLFGAAFMAGILLGSYAAVNSPFDQILRKSATSKSN